MITNINRAISIGLKPKACFLVKRKPTDLIQKRFSGGHDSVFAYRRLAYDPHLGLKEIIAELALGSMYWWIGWNFITDWRHLLGEFVFPTRSEWSDEHLGIPPDDED